MDSHIVHSLFYVVLSTPLAVQSNVCVCILHNGLFIIIIFIIIIIPVITTIFIVLLFYYYYH